MHTDRNHSWLPAFAGPPWYHVEGFLFLSDVDAGTAPTHVVPPATPRVTNRRSRSCPSATPSCSRRSGAAAGVRGSYLAYRTDVLHRAVDMTAPGGPASC